MNYQQQLVVTAVDIDLKCVHMTYLQLALYGVPAVIIHGNSLSCEEWSRWYTPLYIMNNWVWREHCGITNKFCVEDEMIKRASQPAYAALRSLESLIADKPSSDVSSAQVIPTSATEIKSGEPDQIQLVIDDSRDRVGDSPTPTQVAAKTIERKITIKAKSGEQISLFDEL
jgi:hypothetical protein